MKNIICKFTQPIMAIIYVAFVLFGGIQLVTKTATATEQAVIPEKNPPGDIPDSQAFVKYESPLGFSIKVPEGWARSDRSDGAKFADKYNTIDVAIDPSPHGAPSNISIKNHEVVNLVKVGRAVKIESIKSVKLRTGSAILIVYSSNSEPNPVTNKQLRLENNRYLIYQSGMLATINLSAPFGADNVDQWKFISNSFKWH